MADAQLTPSSNDVLSSAVASASSAELGIAKREREEEGKLDVDAAQAKQQIGGIEQQRDDSVARLESQRAGFVQPAPFKPIPPPTPQPTDPKQIWGSAAMFVAAFGGLLTRQPLATAMNAAAGVLKAYQAGDAAAANQAFKTWQAANDNALNASNAEQKAYEQAVAGIDRQENVLERESADKIRAVVAGFTATASAYHNDTALMVAQSNDPAKIVGFVSDLARQNQALETNAAKIVQEHDYMQARAALVATPKFQALVKSDPLKAYKQLQALQPQSLRPLTEEQTDQQETVIYKELDKSTPNTIGSHYFAVVSSLPALLALKHTDAVRDGGTSQTIDVDLFTQLFNGGRAMRGFQIQYLTNNASLLDRAEGNLRLLQSGGHLSGAQINDMIEASKLYAKAIDQVYGAAVRRGQARAMREGLDPENVVPSEYDPNFVNNTLASDAPAGAARPTPKAIDALRAHANDPTYRQSFDKHFGPGAAEKVLGQ